MTIDIGLPEVSLGVLLFAALQYLASLWISEKLKTSLQKEYSQFLEDLKWELKVREQAVRVADYFQYRSIHRAFRFNEGIYAFFLLFCITGSV